jgi:hypothetical protein
MSNGIQFNVSIAICKDGEDAMDRGYNYVQPEYLPIHVEKVVVVKNGTVGGNATVDVVLKDVNGQKHVVMLSGRILQAIAKVCENGQS